MVVRQFGHQNGQQSGQHDLSMKNSTFLMKTGQQNGHRMGQQTGHNLEERTKIKKRRSLCLHRVKAH